MAEPLIEGLKAQAKSAVKPVDHTTSVQAYLNSARNLRLHAESYRKHERPVDSFLFLYRLAFLLVQVLPHHKQWPAATAAQREQASSLAREALDILEAVKPAAIAKLQEDQARAAKQQQKVSAVSLPPLLPSASKSPAAGSKSPSASALSPPPPSAPPAPSSMPLLTRDMSLRSALEGMNRGSHSNSNSNASSSTSVPLPLPLPSPITTAGLAGAGAYPSVSPAMQQRNNKLPAGSSLPLSADEEKASRAARASGGGLSPAGSSLVKREKLRPIVLPASLLDRFALIAEANTVRPPRGIETCGILAGYEQFSEPSSASGGEGGGGLYNGLLSPASSSSHAATAAAATITSRFVVTHLIIPKQSAGADHCEMTAEGEDDLLNYCLSEGLITLGWIHTHPSQGCFMSSLDQHCQCGFQSMLPEAIAIVLAPTDSSMPFAVFRLTDEPGASGLELIQACRETGFHPHDGASFYIYELSGHSAWVETAAGPGAAAKSGEGLGLGLGLVVKDMR